MPEASDECQIGGVCSGLAYWWGIPTWLVRIAFVLGIGSGGVVLMYGLMWFFIPEWNEVPEDYYDVTGG